MTPEQKDLFIKIMQFGNAVGLHTRFECLQAYIESNPTRKEEAIAAAAAYERGCGFCHESAVALAEMTDETFYQFVVEYCQQKKQAA